ncbi:MAG: glycosyltransferase family 2 protein [Nanoarchaeota archaeon]|nr:glycosyltransferase family 2 protein [Nanoarchaeota archaeon]MCG2718463.1 glycosyltransferase family 2 protein [Nanoarchaeota archaeon]
MISLISIIIYFIFLLSIYFAVFWLTVLLQKGIGDEEKELKGSPMITVAIPAYNEESTIGRTIKSVINLDYPKDKLEIIIVDDGSKDNTANIAKKIIAKNNKLDISLIMQKNAGKGSALNAAIKKAKGEFFICIDADSMVREDALKKMLPEFNDPDVAIVLPLMKIKNPKNMLEKIQWYEYLINFFYKKLMAKLDCVHVSPGPFSMYRKKVLKELGEFDENNLTEDLEIAMRTQKHNYKIVQLLSTEVYTYAPTNLVAFYKQRRRWYKGTIFNLVKYRKLIFNPKYGDLGILHLPTVMLSGAIILTIIFVTAYNYVLKPLYYKIHDLSFVNYDYLFFINKWAANFQVIDINVVNIFFGIVTFILGITIIILANKYAQERTFRYGVMLMPIYLIFYGILMFGVWFGVLIEFITGRKQRW